MGPGEAPATRQRPSTAESGTKKVDRTSGPEEGACIVAADQLETAIDEAAARLGIDALYPEQRHRSTRPR